MISEKGLGKIGVSDLKRRSGILIISPSRSRFGEIFINGSHRRYKTPLPAKKYILKEKTVKLGICRRRELPNAMRYLLMSKPTIRRITRSKKAKNPINMYDSR
jgi:hypothetical protein